MRCLFTFMCVLALGLMGCSGGMDIYGACPSPAESEAQRLACESVDACRDDFNECTYKACEAGACTQLPIGGGPACDEDNECTVSGACANGMCVATPVEDGTPCGDGAGMCVSGSCSGRFPCSEAGIQAAIAVGGGPHTFDCDGPTTVLVESPIAINNDVVLDGEDNLTVDHLGDVPNAGLQMSVGRLVVLRRMSLRFSGSVGAVLTIGGDLTLERVSITGERCNAKFPARVDNQGILVMAESTLTDAGCSAILNTGSLRVIRSTIRGNRGYAIWNLRPGWSQVTASTIVGNVAGVFGGPVIIDNSTISDNDIGFNLTSLVTATSSTIVGDTVIGGTCPGVPSCPTRVCFQASVASGACEVEATSLGHNIESPGDTCGFDQTGDQPGVTTEKLNLGPLTDNGGPTLTHKPGDGDFGEGSVAIDAIPEADCTVDTDQRSESRPETGGTTCDVGAVEVQPQGANGGDS